jgi:hypothetical protein
VDLRYFELHDILCEASIALEAGDRARAALLVSKALRWVESEWLATPAEIRTGAAASPIAEMGDVEDD